MEKFTAVFEHHGKWWIGYVEELPGANTQGRTLEETRENLKEAVQLVIEANREIARRQTKRKKVIGEKMPNPASPRSAGVSSLLKEIFPWK